ncbi:MAG: SOS-response transcriptional repressor LexA [Flavobacteriaceae bacterium]|jgi:SOS-response transcriptional repressor LexA|uniref:LexA family transcriptional regulator n=1 Tax=Candidatus Marifrigoribacter sp. Uisw_064 TaxID=3230970 RepID=UPI003AE67D25
MKLEIPIEAKRFKKVREDLKFTQHTFAKMLSIKGSTVDIERGKTKLTGKVVMKLLHLYQINPLWLYGESYQKIIALSNENLSPKVLVTNQENEDSIILVNQKAAAGYPNNIQDVEWYQSLPVFNIPLPQYKNATYRGFQVEGDSMTPNIQPKDWVLGRSVTSISDASDSKIYIVVLKDSVLVKKLQKLKDNSKIRLISFNENYIPIDVEIKEIQELWMVNSKLTFGLEDSSNNHGLLKQLQESMNDLKGQIHNLKTD